MPNDAVSINLDDLQEIMDSLLEAPAGSEKRRNVLTKDDVLVIARVVQAVSHNQCAMGFTAEEIGKVKGFIRAVNAGILGIGWLIVSSFVAAIIGFAGWAAKHGIIEMVNSAKDPVK